MPSSWKPFFLEDSPAGDIAGKYTGVNALQLQVLETISRDEANCFGSVAHAVKFGSYPQTD